MLKLCNIYLSFENFHRPVLSNICTQIHEGDFIILIGGNGSGKSSLLKLLQGLYLPTSGTVYMDDQSIQKQSLESISRQVITLTQGLSMSTFSSLTVFENCQLANLRVSSQSLNKANLIAYLDEFHPDLKNHLHTQTSRLSGGQRQTLALAMALMHPPKLLLLDEHTSALDPKIGHRIMELTARIITQHRITTVMITHELSDALQYGNRLIALKEGWLVFEADTLSKPLLTKDDLLHLCY